MTSPKHTHRILSKEVHKGVLTKEDLLSCVELGKALTAELESGQLFKRIVQKMSELLPAENWSLLLLDEHTRELRFEVAVDLDLDKVKDFRLPLGEGVAGRAALEQRPLIVDETGECGFFCDQVDRLSGKKTQSVIAVPLIFGGKSVGVIELVNIKRLEERTLPLLTIIADYAAIAVENMRRYRRIEEMAIKDNLTGLFNTRHLYRRLEELTDASDVGGSPFSLIFMDVDNFKKVVDTYGHLKGSKTLQEIAATIQATIGERGFGVAYGGDEFIVVLPGVTKPEAILVAEEIRSAMGSSRYLTGEGHKILITASLGVATFPEDAQDAKGILALADRFMFEVKESGKDGIKAYTG